MTSNRRTMIRILAGVTVALAGLACGADLLVEHRTEAQVAARASHSLRARGPVHVDLTTPLAGLRTLGGEVGDIDVSAEGVRHQDTTADVSVRLKDVTTDGDSAGGTATATVGYEQVTRRLDALGDGLTAGADNGDLILRGSVGQLGLPVTVRAKVSTTAHAFTITPTTLDILGRSMSVDDLASLPAASGLRDELAPRTVPVTGLPHGVAFTSARAGDHGLVLAFSIAAGPTPGRDGGAV
ncbi:LmeA family phospholipid-binding protein [Streptomyces sp. NPDC048045]|uniref:LmeA family phospholipid-binding protein n=1 Tax=Streptomyces sp. NPDC048045 TaxID=3154710 RepID=UPI003427B1C6